MAGRPCAKRTVVLVLIALSMVSLFAVHVLTQPGSPDPTVEKILSRLQALEKGQKQLNELVLSSTRKVHLRMSAAIQAQSYSPIRDAIVRTDAQFKESLQSFLKAPKVDVVITWLNSSNITWRMAMKSIPGPDRAKIDATEPYNPQNHSFADTFVELKYMLRSFERYGLMRYVRKVFIVHSDLYSPPNYLNGQHEQLQFVKHSDMWLESAKEAGLPNFNRNAIDSNVHRIPGLAEWYMTMMDDQFLLQPFTWKEFVGQKGLLTRMEAGHYGDDGYYGAMERAKELLSVRYGPRSRTISDHEPYLAWRPARELMDTLWPAEHEATAKSQFAHPSNLHLGCFYKNFVVDVGYGEHFKRDLLYEIHTNANICRRPCDGYLKDASMANVLKLKSLLDRLLKDGQVRWANFQGPGFDDAYRFRQNS